MGSIITDQSRSRHSRRITGFKSSSHTSQTGTGSSSRRTSYGDPLSKKWENRTLRGEDWRAHNIDAIRKGYVMHKLGITNQGRMDRVKLALTHPYGSTDINWEDRPSYDDKLGQEWEVRHAKRMKERKKAIVRSEEFTQGKEK